MTAHTWVPFREVEKERQGERDIREGRETLGEGEEEEGFDQAAGTTSVLNQSVFSFRKRFLRKR